MPFGNERERIEENRYKYFYVYGINDTNCFYKVVVYFEENILLEIGANRIINKQIQHLNKTMYLKNYHIPE